MDHAVGKAHDKRKETQPELPDNQIEHVGQCHRGKDPVDEPGMVLEDQRTGLHAVHEERADQDRGRQASGDTERQERNEVRAGHRAVRGLDRGYSFQPAGAELLRLR